MRKHLRTTISSTLLTLCLASASAMADLDGGRREYAAQHYKEALAALQAPAMAGDAEAEALMGKIYLENYGPPRFQSAQFWLQKAVIAGNEDARYYLGIVNTLLANANAAQGHSADTGATVDNGGKVTAYRMVRMTVKVPANFQGPLLSTPYYGRKEGILFGKGAVTDPVSVVLFLSAVPYEAGAAHDSAEQRQALAAACLDTSAAAYRQRADHFVPGQRQSLTIAGAPAARLETNGSDHQYPLYGAAYCIAAEDQMYTFQVVQLGTGAHDDAKTAMQAIESATHAKD